MTGTPAAYDLLFRGVRIIDGTGADSRSGDVAVKGDRIVAIGDLGSSTAKKVFDCDGLVLAPGFIRCPHP